MSKLETLKIVEVTTPRQLKNGTRAFFDSIANCKYLSYESGYIRRQTTTKQWRTGKTMFPIYQLNPTRTITTWSNYGNGANLHKERILIHNPEYRLELIARAVVNYRNYCQN